MVEHHARIALIGVLTLAVAPDPAGAQKKALPVPGEVFAVDAHTAFVIEPAESARRAGPLPWVWYAPTLGPYPGAAEKWMFDRFLAAGIAVAGIDVGESYGSPSGRALYQALYDELTTSRAYGRRPVLLARSRGGLMLYNWAAEHPESVGAIAGIYPVCDLASYPGLARAAPAYGMTEDELAARLAEHNPIDRLAPLARAGVPILHLHGDDDRTVPLPANSATLRARYAALGGPVELRVMEGHGHDMWSGWFESSELTRFVIDHALGRPSNAPAPAKLAREKLQVFLMLGQSNMVGLADIRTFQYLLQEPYAPGFDEVKDALKSGVYYSRIYSRYGWELGNRMRHDPKHVALHPRELRSLIRRTTIATLPEAEQVTERDLYDDMRTRLDARLPLRRRMAARYLAGTSEADFARLGALIERVRQRPEVRADPRLLRLAYAEAVRRLIHLPIAERTYIASYGAFQAPGGKGIRSEASGPLSIGWGGRYTTIGPEYGFGIAMEELLDAPILIIKCAWGNTALNAAWRPPSAPPRTETPAERALREARNAALTAKAEAEGSDFEPIPATHAPSPGWCWTEMKFQHHIRKVLADPAAYHPGYDETAGYEVAGLVWFQGHSDFGYDSGKEYERTMAHFIRDLRRLVDTPAMPVVIGTTSTDVHKARNVHSPLTRSQLAVAELPEFEHTVTTVDTLPFYPTELHLLRAVMQQVRQADPQRTSPESARLARYMAISNRGYHYMGSAECFVEMSDAFATAMVELMRKR